MWKRNLEKEMGTAGFIIQLEEDGGGSTGLKPGFH